MSTYVPNHFPKTINIVYYALACSTAHMHALSMLYSRVAIIYFEIFNIGQCKMIGYHTHTHRRDSHNRIKVKS